MASVVGSRASSTARDATAPLPGSSPVVVEPFAALPAQEAGGDHAAQAGHGGVVGVLELLVEGVEDRQRRVEADEVEQRQGPHREVAAALHGGVDVVAAGGAVLEQP